jgi:hypothetical protein
MNVLERLTRVKSKSTTTKLFSKIVSRYKEDLACTPL